jgi:hypothetical protein
VWLDRRVSGEHILLGNAGVSPAQVAATVVPVVIGLESTVYVVSSFA